MTTIWKYPVPISETFTLSIPEGAIFVAFQLQGNELGVPPDPYLWVEVNSEAPKREFRFFIVGTGHEIPSTAKHHLGTIQAGPFVWHLYCAEFL